MQIRPISFVLVVALVATVWGDPCAEQVTGDCKGLISAQCERFYVKHTGGVGEAWSNCKLWSYGCAIGMECTLKRARANAMVGGHPGLQRRSA